MDFNFNETFHVKNNRNFQIFAITIESVEFCKEAKQTRAYLQNMNKFISDFLNRLYNFKKKKKKRLNLQCICILIFNCTSNANLHTILNIQKKEGKYKFQNLYKMFKDQCSVQSKKQICKRKNLYMKKQYKLLIQWN